MPKTIKNWLALVAVLSLSLKLILAAVIFIYPNVISETNIEANARELIDLTNDYRKKLGLGELAPNARLTQAAVNKAQDLLAKQYFAHTSLEGKKFSDWIKEVDYKYFYVGENLAIDFNSNQAIFQAWISSTSHRQNIIKPQYQEIGLAVIEGKYQNRPTTVVVQLFGSRVLGESETLNTAYLPAQKTLDNYFLPENFWQKITSLKNLERLNIYNNYFLLIVIGLYLITYKPLDHQSQINVKQPIINRYQAKTFKE